MIVGERIRERLKVVGLSQSELARRVKISQPAINGLIRGSARSSTHLHRIARELGTTPEYLGGETDDPDAAAPPAPVLDSDARELLAHFTLLDPADRRALLQIARTMTGRLFHSMMASEPRSGHQPKAGDQ